MRTIIKSFRGGRPHPTYQETIAGNQTLFRTMRVRLRAQRSDSSSPNSGAFISKSAVDNVLTFDVLNNVFQPYQWHTEDVIEEICRYMRRVVAALILIEWDGWEDFETNVLKWKDSSQRPVLGDHSLPFVTRERLEFIGDLGLRREFEKVQYELCPITIVENRHETYGSNFKLPFIAEKFLKGGMHGSVRAVKIEKGQIKYTTESHAGTIDLEPKWMALKVLTADQRGTQSFEREKHNTESFKKALSKCKNVMPTFATFVHDHKLNIISPLADLDLFDLLEGKFSTFERRARHFSPQNLLQQMHDLAGALHFLHEELYLNRQASCAHMDLKPENILINWTYDGDTFPVGFWRISDFGLSAIRDKPTENNKGLATTGDMIRESSSMQPPRDAGPFQPPEMQKDPDRKSTVSKSSDLWSFGAILAMVLSFAIGGPQKTRELVRCRSDTYDDDSFWTEQTELKDGEMTLQQIIKPQINSCFDEQIHLSQSVPSTRSWIKPCIQLIRELLKNPKRDRRPASYARDELSIIWQAAGGQCLWLVAPSTMADPFSSGIRRRPSPALQRDVGTLTAIVPTSNLPAPSHERDSDNLSRQAIQSNTSPRRDVTASNTRVEPLPLRERANSFQMEQAPKGLRYITLPTPERCFCSCLSAESHAVTFISASKVMVYRLENLLKNEILWSEKSRRPQKVSGDCQRSFNIEDGRQWTSALIAGDFVALVSKSKGINHQMYAEVYQNIFERSNIELEASRRIDLPDEYQDIRLSSKGATLIMFADYLRIETSSRPYTLPSLGPGARFDDATFSIDGNWLCGWYTRENREHWLIYDTTKWEVQKVQWRRISMPPSNGVPLRPILIPFHGHAMFAACDPYGRISLIRDKGPKEPELLDQEQRGPIIAGIATPADDVLILIRKMSAELNPCLHVLQIQHQVGASRPQSRYYGAMTRHLSTIGCGITITEIESSMVLLASFTDGIIMKAGIGK